MEQFLYKKRSVSGCLSEGYRLYRKNLANILKAIWKEGIVTSMAFGAALTALTRMNAPAGIIAGAVAALVFLAGLFFYKRKVFSMTGESPTKWKAKTALRHFGFILSMALLSGIICLSLFAVICIPLAFLLSAMAMDNAGIAAGDTSGLPGYFGILLFAVSSVSMFAVLYVQVWQTFASCFVHGSICKVRKEE